MRMAGNMINNSQIDRLSVIYTNAGNLLNKTMELKLVISSMQIKPRYSCN